MPPFSEGGYMKVLTLKIDGKTHTTVKITAWMAKEAIKINRDSIAIAKKASAISGDETDLDLAEEIYSTMEELSDRKANLICEVFGRKFTAEDLEKELTTEEIDNQVNNILGGVTGTIEKN